ncbi:MAG: hypothetical protein ABI317_09695 [Gaiellales bacterium]
MERDPEPPRAGRCAPRESRLPAGEHARRLLALQALADSIELATPLRPIACSEAPAVYSAA